MNHQLLKNIFKYIPDTGEFLWKVRPSQRVKIGDKAGTKKGNGYLMVRFEGKNYLLHRLAWIIIHESEPEGMIDHINGNRSDNRIVNLRVVSSIGNAQNQRNSHKDSKSGLLGVSEHRGLWAAQIMCDGVMHRLGLFKDKFDAHNAYVIAKKKLHETSTLQ